MTRRSYRRWHTGVWKRCDRTRQKLEKSPRASQRERNLKLKKEKVKLRLTEVTYIGHRLASNGLKPDPKKVEAIVNMPTPKDLPELRRFLGMVNYLSKFLPNLSTVTDSLRKLEEKDTVWCWEDHHDQAIAEVKKMITQEPVLKFYDATQPMTLQCDASQTGLGATILQQGQLVAFASRALTDTRVGKNVYFPGSWPIFPQFIMCFYVQKDKISQTATKKQSHMEKSDRSMKCSRKIQKK